MVGKPLASESFPVGTDLIQRARQSFVGDEQIAVPDVRTLNPSAPRLPSLLGNGLQKFVVLLSASRQKDTVLSQQAPVFSEPSLDISGRGLCIPMWRNSVRWVGDGNAMAVKTGMALSPMVHLRWQRRL